MPRVLSMFIHTPIDGAFLEKHPAIRLIATRSTGIDHIDLDACRARGITIANVPTYGDHTVAEHTFALILTLSRRLRETIRPPGETDRVAYSDVRGFDLRDKTLGVVGAGRIGRHVIRIARAFGMRVLAFDPYLPIPADQEGGFEYAPFEKLLAESHVITLHLPGRAETHHLLNADAFARCRPGVMIVNTSRGSLIDTEALLDALDGGQVGGAGLDVLEEDSLIRQEPTRLIGAQIINRLRSLHASEAVADHEIRPGQGNRGTPAQQTPARAAGGDLHPARGLQQRRGQRPHQRTHGREHPPVPARRTCPSDKAGA